MDIHKPFELTVVTQRGNIAMLSAAMQSQGLFIMSIVYCYYFGWLGIKHSEALCLARVATRTEYPVVTD